MGREGSSRGREYMYIYLWLICVVVQQKPTQHCKSITLQIKTNIKKERNIVNLLSESNLISNHNVYFSHSTIIFFHLESGMRFGLIIFLDNLLLQLGWETKGPEFCLILISSQLIPFKFNSSGNLYYATVEEISEFISGVLQRRQW